MHCLWSETHEEKKESVYKFESNSECTAFEAKHTKTAICIFNGGRPRILKDTLAGPQKSTPTVRNGRVAQTLFVGKFLIIWNISLGL